MSSKSDVKNITKASMAPPGLRALIEQCQNLYPDQPNPLQVTTVLKYWLGGNDPLDYISMYFNKGDPENEIPPHWHYISFGLSDLHGDGRVHLSTPDLDGEQRSGMGFELTFRLIKKDTDGDRPPTWPATLLQAIARYCFQTGNRLFPGDNFPWRKALDGSSKSRLLQHILISEDAQLTRTETPFGWMEFCQIVGVTEEELEQASRWNGRGILNLLKRDKTTGGEWLITDMERSKSVFELFPETLRQLEDDLEKEGSDLAGVNAEFTFKEVQKKFFKTEIDSDSLNEQCASDRSEMSQSFENDGGSNMFRTMSISNSLQKCCPLNYQPKSVNVIPLDGIEIILAPYAAKFLYLAIKDRVRHGRHFTFKSQNLALTFVAESVTGAAVNNEFPYGVIGYWVQVLISDDLIPRMMDSFRNVLSSDNEMITKERKEFEWPDKNLKIIIDNPSSLLNSSKILL